MASGPLAVGVGGAGVAMVVIGIAGANFLPESKSVEYSHEIEEVIDKVWDLIDEHKSDIWSVENDYNNGVHALRNVIFGINSFNLEMYDITENNPEGNVSGGGERLSTGYGVDVDVLLGIADKCFEAAEAYEDNLIPLIADVREADAELAGEDGDEGFADPKVKDLVDEFEGYLKTACGRLYTAGEQIKAAADEYADIDDEQRGLFDSYNWDEGSAPSQAGDWAQDTDRSGWEVPIPGAPPYVTDTTPGGEDVGEQDYATELSSE